MSGFVHLAAKTCYSLRDGVIRPAALAAAVATRGMDTVGVADRDGLYGAVRLAQACAIAGVRPIFGADLALTCVPRRSRPGWAPLHPPDRRRPSSGPAWMDDHAARVVLLARTQAGYATLCRTVTDAHLDGPTRGHPRVRWEHLVRRAGGVDGGGLLVLLGDDSPPARLLDAGRFDAATAEARRWMDLVGPENVLVGVTHHLAPGDDAKARARFGLADRLGLRAVAHQAARYLDPADAPVADVMAAVRQQVPLAQRHAGRRNTEGYLKTPEQMAAVFAARPDALTNTVWAAERCEARLELGRRRVPDYLGCDDPDAELRARCEAGLAERFAAPGQTHRDRLEAELAMIASLGLAAYFLTVAEITDWIREKQIMVACRGSAAGSLIAYCLRISDVDPIAHDLVFERFANPYRDELPDIDLDVESARREDIYAELMDRYGTDRVACVAMVETFRARMAVREVGKALGLPADEVGVVAKSFPHIRARDLRAALASLPELRGRNLDAGQYGLLFDVAERLDGLPRHLALHPSGVLLADTGLGELLPFERSAAGFSMVQVDKDDVEALGLCKLDILAVRMLSAMAHAVDEVRRVRGVEVDLGAVADDDEATFSLIRSTRTIGCFQIESPGQRELLGKFQPTEFSDLIIDISLFRPGPVKGDMVGPFLRRHHGLEPTAYPHPMLVSALAETHGVIVYHEQVMRCVAAVTGCDLSVADLVRRRLGDETRVPALRRWFLDAARRRGVDADAAETLWAAIAQFASFGFCKAHAAAFAVPTYRSAWLKAHWMPELVAGLLTHDPGMYPRRLIVEDARQFGIAVLGVDVNRSGRDYRVERLLTADAYACLGVGALPRGWRRGLDGALLPPAGFDFGADPERPGWRFAIRLGLQDVAGIDDAMVDSLLAHRPFTSIADLRRRSSLSAPVAEALAHIGALDGLVVGGSSRRDLLLEVTERWSDIARHRPADPTAPAQLSLLEPAPAPGLAPYRSSEQTKAELEVLGVDASTHVLRFYEALLARLDVTAAADLPGCRAGQRVRVAGAKVATQTPPIRSGRRVIFLSLDDATGVADAAFFEAVHDDCAWTVFHTWLLLVEGTVRRTGKRGVSVNAERVWDLTALMAAWQQGSLDLSSAQTLGGRDSSATVAPSPPGAGRPGRWSYASGGSAG